VEAQKQVVAAGKHAINVSKEAASALEAVVALERERFEYALERYDATISEHGSGNIVDVANTEMSQAFEELKTNMQKLCDAKDVVIAALNSSSLAMARLEELMLELERAMG
jgi:hypothetical protein